MTSLPFRQKPVLTGDDPGFSAPSSALFDLFFQEFEIGWGPFKFLSIFWTGFWETPENLGFFGKNGLELIGEFS